MVDKVDRPEAPPTWRIKEAKRTQDDRPSQQQQESAEKKKEKFEKRNEGTWQKFDSRSMIVKPMRIPLRDIKSVIFRNVTMHSGITTMEGDLHWTSGRVTEGAMFGIGGFDEFVKAKRFQPGQEVPREVWAKSDPLEVGIPQERAPSGPFAMEEIERQVAAKRTGTPPRKKRGLLSMLGLIDANTGQFQWAVFILYAIIAIGLALGIHALLTMTRV
jgi:hypothetical protein